MQLRHNDVLNYNGNKLSGQRSGQIYNVLDVEWMVHTVIDWEEIEDKEGGDCLSRL